MANPELVDLLKQGVGAWNQWRQEQDHVTRVNLNYVTLNNTDLTEVNLSSADLNHARLTDANLINTDLTSADLHDANLVFANPSNAILSGADLSHANLRGANLIGARLDKARLNGIKLHNVKVGWTIFGECDLRVVSGIETARHFAPSLLSINTIYLSNGDIPEAFVRGTGDPDIFLDYMRSLAGHPIDFYSCFISYSSRDEPFARRLCADLQSKGVRFWFAPEELKIGERIRSRIDKSIRIYDKLLLVLSRYSIASQWVEQEVETALAKERGENRIALFPIRLDSAIMDATGGWPALIRNTRYIADFTHWKRHNDYLKAFDRLLRDLKAEA